mmetsp:Transcript_7756/g.7316  ORF Transcript_7756/g.7316 Transcript_7756/m.7316 type:complete len:148 (+) Transcript_7756:743-1186(+)
MVSQVKVPEQKKKPQVKPQSKPKKQVITIEAAPKPAVEIPKEIKSDEVKDPDVQRNLFSLYYCTQRYKQINEKVTSYQKRKVRIPKDLQTELLKFQKQKISLEAAIENEQVTYEQYIDFLQKSLAHDKILVQYVIPEKKKLVEFRIE